MRYLVIAIGLLLLPIYVASCANNVSGYMGCASQEARQSEIVAKARELVFASDVPLGPNEIEFVQNQIPDIHFYALAGGCGEDAQYFIEWQMPDARLVITGIGNPYEMDSATVKRVEE